MVGVDEVGRGAWAGPLLVVAAKQIAPLPNGCADSKSLTSVKRLKLHNLLRQSCKISKGWVQPSEIDRLGLAEALKLGYARALDGLKIKNNHQIIVDGSVNYAPSSYTQVSIIIKADQSVPIVSAASICAKVERDLFMNKLSKKYPAYGFDSHKGYGTARHRFALTGLGPVVGLHRRSFKPISQFLVSP